MEAAEVSEDDLELDSEDVDDELIEAMREVATDKKQRKLLRKAEALPAGSKEQRAAIRKAWVALTPAQRRQIVEDSGSEEEDEEEEQEEESDDDNDAEIEQAAPPCPAAAAAAAARGVRGGGGGGDPREQKRATGAPTPPPAQRSCARGHALTAINSKPRDYAKLTGNVGNCDLCGVDYKYTVTGGYHCDTCRNWDCCVDCGVIAPGVAHGGGSGGGKASHQGKRSKRK